MVIDMKEIEERIEKLEEKIKKIEERNKKVELNKKWETCNTRKIFIIIFTYIFASLYLTLADTTNPFLGAVVPCAGFFLSTWSLKLIRQIWEEKIRK